MRRQLLQGALLFAAALTVSCENGNLQGPGASGPVNVGLAFSVAGGSPEAYDKANRIFVQFTAGQEVRFEQELPFAPSGETRLPIRVPLRSPNETFAVSIELRRDADALFTGNAQTALSSERAASVNLTLLPVAASLSCGGSPLQLSAYGASAQLTGAALFATGDTIQVSSISWSTAANGPVTVTTGGRVTAVRDGNADVQCSTGTMSGTRQVQVFAVVRSIAVAPDRGSVAIGGTQAFTATMRDANGNVIPGRTPSWSSSNTAVATITAAGVANGVAPGNVRIDAISAGVTGSATLTVSNPIPIVTTGQANVVRVTAFIDGTVNPNGNATQAYFEWGTSPSLAGANTTTARSLGNGTAPLPVNETLSNLGASTTYYYRVVASNSGGVSRGLIQNFRTIDPGLPIPTTGSGSSIPGNPIITLNGDIIPMGSPTRYFFQYGSRQDSLFYQVPGPSTVPPLAGSGFDPVPVSVTIQWTGRLFVRLVATNQFGTVPGAIVDMGFRPQIVTPPVQRGAGTPVKVNGNQQE
jgi:hypothetical protein